MTNPDFEVGFQSKVIIATFGVFVGVFWGYISNRERYITKHLKKIKTGTVVHSLWATFIVLMNLFIGTSVSMALSSLLEPYTNFKIINILVKNPFWQIIGSFIVGITIMPLILWVSETSLKQKLETISSITAVLNKISGLASGILDWFVRLREFMRNDTNNKKTKSDNDST